jgi:Bacteriophage tail sheath protein
MPVAVSYPGVYVEEIPSGVRTITGVATSITAFIGRAERGEVNASVVINSFGDFERYFGGLGVNYPMSYAVRDFYLNGGSQAIIVRLYGASFASETDRQKGQTAANDVAAAAVGADKDLAAQAARTKANTFAAEPEKTPADTVAKAAEAAALASGATPASVKAAADEAALSAALHNKAIIKLGSLTLEAASEGSWGNNLRVRIDNKVSSDVAARYGLPVAKLFNLTVRDTKTGNTETFLNVTGEESPRRIDRVLLNESTLIRATGSAPFPVPTPHTDPAAGKTIWDDDNASTKVQAADKAGDSNALKQTDYDASKNNKTGMYALEKADLFNILCIPPDTRDGDTKKEIYASAMAYCVERRAMLIVDAPVSWTSANGITSSNNAALTALGLTGTGARNAALYFPRVLEADPLRDGQTDTFVPCGIIAGVMARTDSQRGVWKAPAGLDAALVGTQGLSVVVTDAENGMLNPLGINCLRSFPVVGRVVWGARTLRGADISADEYKYVPVRRTALFIEESLFRGLKWVVFEPNDEPLWAQIRLNVGAFMNNLFRQGAFQGTTPKDAYFVKCDKETTTQNDINLGIVNIVVGFAPLKPAEFVIIKLQQMAGQIEV